MNRGSGNAEKACGDPDVLVHIAMIVINLIMLIIVLIMFVRFYNLDKILDRME